MNFYKDPSRSNLNAFSWTDRWQRKYPLAFRVIDKELGPELGSMA